jgi:hypothetical protein
MHQLLEHFEEAHVLVLDATGRRIHPAMPASDSSSESGSDSDSASVTSSSAESGPTKRRMASLVVNYPQPHPLPVQLLSTTAPDPRSAAVDSMLCDEQCHQPSATPDPMQCEFVAGIPSKAPPMASTRSSEVLSALPLLQVPQLPPLPALRSSATSWSDNADADHEMPSPCVTPGLLSRAGKSVRKGISSLSSRKASHGRTTILDDVKGIDVATDLMRASAAAEALATKRLRGKGSNRPRYACPVCLHLVCGDYDSRRSNLVAEGRMYQAVPQSRWPEVSSRKRHLLIRAQARQFKPDSVNIKSDPCNCIVGRLCRHS